MVMSVYNHRSYIPRTAPMVTHKTKTPEAHTQPRFPQSHLLIRPQSKVQHRPLPMLQGQ